VATNEPVPPRDQQTPSRDQQLGSPDQQVTSPDQLKPGPGRVARVGAAITVALLLMMAFFANGGSQVNRVGLVYLLLIATVIVGALVVDWLLRRNGLRD
jgi:hypothetical protein